MNRYFLLAKKVALLSNHKFRMGAVLVHRHKVVSIGNNNYKTHPLQINHHTGSIGSSVHAELNCLLNAHPEHKRNADIYIVRLLSNNELGKSKPCRNCSRLLINEEIRRVVYFDNEIISVNSWDM